MTPAMNAAGNGKMDWFFDEWVNGTEVPSYSMDTTTETTPDGKVGKLGQVLLVGNQTITQKVPFGAVAPKRLMINYNYDVLSTN